MKFQIIMDSVFCGESAIEDFAQLNWVDEALFSIPTELALPDKMIKNFGIMGITIHIKLARVADDSSNQIVEKLEGYTVLSTSINMVSAGQLIFKGRWISAEDWLECY